MQLPFGRGRFQFTLQDALLRLGAWFNYFRVGDLVSQDGLARVKHFGAVDRRDLGSEYSELPKFPKFPALLCSGKIGFRCSVFGFRFSESSVFSAIKCLGGRNVN